GIIDDGIDITHPEFLDASGKTRLKALWNMDRAGGTPPAGYWYGHDWSPDSINGNISGYNSGFITRFDMQRKFGYSFHGTPVTGLAAGKNGIAPGADIVSVALTAFGDTILHSNRIIDAIAYIYSKAQEADKKCVVNISLGLMDGGPHDGKTMVERAIDEFCEGKPDILVCVSAGNNGNTWKHWGGVPIHADSSFGFFKCAYSAPLYFSIPKQYSNTLRISLTDSKLKDQAAPNYHRDSIFAQTPYLLISDLIQNGPVTINTLLPNGSPSSRLTFTAAHANDDYDELIVNVSELTSSSSNFDFHLYRFIWKGTGTVHAWFPFFNLHPAFVFTQNPYPNDPTYRSCDNEYTTIIPSHAYSVLSTGAYNVRNCYVNIQGNVVNQYPKCQLTYFTSHGPTADGRIKPDIINPGENVLAPKTRMDTFLGHEFILSDSWESFGGTSASSPITAGMAALIWEAHPDFVRDSIMGRIKNNTYTDTHTNTNGPVPNNVAGNGKADVFKALTGITTSYQSICDQWLVCVSTNNPPTNPPVTNPNFFKVFPNPNNGILYVFYRSEVHLRVAFYNSIGQLVKLEWLQAGENLYKQIDLQHLATGPYYMKVSERDESFTEKILIVR
ncbi:MAG TPA: S8/S53 family peptidase, partial [Chitinophagaceae bacterium]|nr:S8/S53 family peptidase [Chitinophagaceae bacterium]